jgi:hypothetical protein
VTQAIRSFLLSLSFVTIFGCGDYEIPLRNGYFIARVSSGTWAIVAPDRRVLIGPSVDKYAVKGDVVVGRVRISGSDTVAYFIVNDKNRRGHQL